MLSTFVTFAGVSLVATLVPGPDTAVVLKNAVVHGRRGSWWTALGCSTSQIGWGALSAAGAATLLTTSVLAFTVLKWVGVAYLGYLGIRSLLAAAHRVDSASEAVGAPATVATSASGWSRYRDGLLVTALNPKTALFMTALLPQFIAPGQPAWTGLALACITGAISFTVMSGYGAAVSAFAGVLRSGPVKRATDALMGCTLVAFAGRLATQARP
jgi:threonine/homoserine/homoserine lactone efflux protein